jgi:tripartite ATP-independent transporter DctP family solute receptor
MISSIRSWSPLIALLIAVSTISGHAVAETLIKLAHPNRNDPFDNSTAAMAVVFKNVLETNSAGAIRVDIYPEGQLGKDMDVVMLVQDGVIQSVISSTVGVERIYPLLGVLDLPFAFPSIATTYAVLDGPFGQRLSADITRKTGLHVVGFGDSGGFFGITNSKHPIQSPADMAGLKIRTMGLETHNVIVRSLGAEAVPLAFSELYGALKTGTVDGQINPVPVIRFAQLDQVQKYLTATRLVFAPYVWVMNGAFWNDLGSQDKALVDDAARAAIVANRGFNRILEASDRGLPALKQRMDVYLPSAIELNAFRRASEPAIRAYIDKIFGREGSELLDSLSGAIEEAAK